MESPQQPALRGVGASHEAREDQTALNDLTAALAADRVRVYEPVGLWPQACGAAGGAGGLARVPPLATAPSRLQAANQCRVLPATPGRRAHRVASPPCSTPGCFIFGLCLVKFEQIPLFYPRG